MAEMSRIEKRFVNSPAHGRRVGRHAARMLERVGPPAGWTYLDVGCGAGAAAIHLAREYQLLVTGVDVDPAQVRIARERGGGLPAVRFLAVDATRLPFGAGEFDIVATNKVTHHIPQWEDALAEMLRVLRPGGFFLYADLVAPGWLAAVGSRLSAGRAGLPTARALDAFVRQRGLTVVHRARSWLHYESVCRAPGM